MTLIRVVSIDPALNNLGLALCDVNIETLEIFPLKIKLTQTDNQTGKVVRKNSDDLRRAKELLAELQKWEALCHMAIAEVPTGTQSARGAMSNGICVGILAAVKIPLVQVQPTEVKKAVTGRSTASKDEMIQWAYSSYPDLGWIWKKRKGVISLTLDNEHMADALAATHAGVLTEQFRAACVMFSSMRSLAA